MDDEEKRRLYMRMGQEGERAAVVAKIAERREIYVKKRDQCDPFAEDTWNRRDAFNLVVEAFDILLTETDPEARAHLAPHD